MKHIFCMRNKFIVLSAECIKPRWTTVTASRVCLIFCHFNCRLLWTRPRLYTESIAAIAEEQVRRRSWFRSRLKMSRLAALVWSC